MKISAESLPTTSRKGAVESLTSTGRPSFLSSTASRDPAAVVKGAGPQGGALPETSAALQPKVFSAALFHMVMRPRPSIAQVARGEAAMTASRSAIASPRDCSARMREMAVPVVAPRACSPLRSEGGISG